MLLRQRLWCGSGACFLKLFPRDLGRTGGMATLDCPHRVTYCLWNLVQSESPEDIATLFTLLKDLPNVLFYDFWCGCDVHFHKLLSEVWLFLQCRSTLSLSGLTRSLLCAVAARGHQECDKRPWRRRWEDL